MSDLVRNPEDRFSHNEAHIMKTTDKTLPGEILPDSDLDNAEIEESEFEDQEDRTDPGNC